MVFSKPDVNDVWAASGEIVEPAQAKVDQGWVSEIPDFEFENWVQNRSDSFAAHVNQFGVPVWDAVTEYQANKSYVQGSDGIIYRAITTNTNKNPASNPSDWGRAFDAPGTSYSQVAADARFMQKTANLSDLNNKATARTELSVYSKTESDAKYQPLDPLVGMVVAFPVSTAPSGWLECDGSAVSRSTYSALFTRIGTTWGAGDGSTTFNLPDLRGEFIRGFDNGRGVDVGRVFATNQGSELKSHNHTGTTNTTGSHTHSGSANSAGSHSHTYRRTQFRTVSKSSDHRSDSQVVGYQEYNTSTFSAGNHTHSLSINSGGDHSHTLSINSSGGSETRPRNVAMLYCIKV